MFCHFLYTWLEVNNKGLKIASWSDGEIWVGKIYIKQALIHHHGTYPPKIWLSYLHLRTKYAIERRMYDLYAKNMCFRRV